MDLFAYFSQTLIGLCVIQAIVVLGMGRVRARSGERASGIVPSVLCAGAGVAAYVSPTPALLTLAGALFAVTLLVASWARPIAGPGREAGASADREEGALGNRESSSRAGRRTGLRTR